MRTGARRDGERSLLGEDHLLRQDRLLDGVVHGRLQRQPIDLDPARVHPLPPVVAGHVREEGLDHERSTRGQPAGDVGEAPHLVLLSEQREECVEHEIDERVVAIHPDVCEVTHGDGDGFSSRLRAELRDHCLRGIYPVDRDPASSKRQGDAARPDGELQRGAVPRQPGEDVHDLVLVEELLVQLVVDAGDAIAVGGVAAPVHGPVNHFAPPGRRNSGEGLLPPASLPRSACKGLFGALVAGPARAVPRHARRLSQPDGFPVPSFRRWRAGDWVRVRGQPCRRRGRPASS